MDRVWQLWRDFDKRNENRKPWNEDEFMEDLVETSICSFIVEAEYEDAETAEG